MHGHPRARRSVVVGVAVTCLLMAGCSSGDSAGSGASLATGEVPTAAAVNAQVACSRLYALDLFRRTTVTSAGSLNERGRVDALKTYREFASGLVSAVSAAVTIGALPASVQSDADRIDRSLQKVAKAGGNVVDTKGTVDARIARRSARIEVACIAAGVAVPQENLDARSG